MTRPLCDHTEDDGTPCPSWAIVGYDRCVAHWQPGIGPKRLHAPAYKGPYEEGSSHLDRPVQDAPAEPAPARPYTPESTETPETVETPAENESPEDAMPARLAELPEPTAEELAAFRAAWEETWSRHTLAPNPPSRRGWRRIFRRAA